MRARPTVTLPTIGPNPAIRAHRRAAFAAGGYRPLPGDPEPLRHPRAVAAQAAGWHHPAHLGQFTWLEHDDYPHGDPAGIDEAFVLVGFGDRSDAPTRHPIDRAVVGALPGQPLDEYVVCAPTHTGEE